MMPRKADAAFTVGESKKKPALDIVLESGRKPSATDDDATTDDDEESSEDYSASAGEVFDALKTDDREGFITALKAALMTCK